MFLRWEVLLGDHQGPGRRPGPSQGADGSCGSFLMEFSPYDEPPSHIQQKIIAAVVKEGRIRPGEED